MRAIARSAGWMMPIHWYGTNGGLVLPCPRCFEDCHAERAPEGGYLKVWCEGCKAEWVRGSDKRMVSNLGLCAHRARYVAVDHAAEDPTVLVLCGCGLEVRVPLSDIPVTWPGTVTAARGSRGH